MAPVEVCEVNLLGPRAFADFALEEACDLVGEGVAHQMSSRVLRGRSMPRSFLSAATSRAIEYGGL